VRLSILAGALALAALGACKKDKPVPHATVEECTAYRNKMFSFLPIEEQQAAAKMGMDKPMPLELKLCQERMVSDEIKCALAATTQDAALACKSAHDIRPADAKRTPEECTALTAHVLELAESNESGNEVGPPFTPAMSKMFSRECERWMTKSRYDCVMRADSPMGLTSCKP
jgi:hypothetical protein